MGQSPKGSTVSNDGKIPLLNGPTEFGNNYPIPVQFTTDPKRFAKKGDLLFCVRGSTGKMNWADQDYAIGRGLAAIRPKDQLSKYFLRGSIEFFLKHLISAATGSVFTSINKDQLHKMKCFIPDKKSIKSINKVLGNFSKKIELNQKMNEIIEEIAKALFKSWFIDFDPVRAKAEGRSTGLSKEISDLFPNSFEDSELGEIPKGWKIRKFSDFYKIEKGLSYKGKFLTKEEEEGMPMINLGCFGGNGVFLKSKIKFYKGDFNKKHVVEAEEIAIANTDITQNRITLGSPIIVEKKGNQYKFLFTHHVFCLRNINNRKDLTIFSYLSLLQPKFRHIAGGHATGTTVLALPKDAIENFQFCLPNKKIIEKFNSLIFPIFEKIRLTRNENDLLTKIRDFLLPKLISGELRIPDAEKIIEEVVN
jgi:type I restriction enzyme S subunit